MNILRNTIDYLAPVTRFNKVGGSLKNETDSVYSFNSDFGKANTSTEMFYSLLSVDDFTDLDVIESVNKEVNSKLSIDRLDNVQELLNFTSFGKARIPEQRITCGFEAGLIDLGKNALLKTDRGWVNHNQEVVADHDATIDKIKEVSKEYAITIPSFNLSQLDDIEKHGVLYINEVLVAEKDEDGNWIGGSRFFDGNYPDGKRFQSGEVVRLIAHSNLEVAIYGHREKEPMYHGNVSNTLKPNLDHKTLKGSSRQGEGAYFTGSINEAVKVYGNPKSFEVSGKLLGLHEKDVIDRKDFVVGHLYEAESSASLFPATFESGYVIDDLAPSLSTFVLLARELGINEVFATMEWHRMKDGGSSYSVYQSVNALNDAATGQEIFPKVFKSMGFEGVSVEFPSEKLIEKIKSQIDELDAIDSSYFHDRKISKNSIVETLKTNISMIEHSIPARAEKKHVIVFDESKITKSHLKVLPLNSGDYCNQSEPYCYDDEITLEDVMEFSSPGFDEMKKYWLSVESNNESELSI